MATENPTRRIEYLTNSNDLTKVANAIRSKGGTTAPLVYPDGFEAAILAITTGTDTSDATGGAAQMLSGYTAYGAGGKFTGSIQSLGAQTFQPSTSDQTIPAGKYLSGAQKIAKMVLQEKVVTLSAEQQVLTPPAGVTGFSKVTVPAASPYKFYTDSVTSSDGSTSLTIPAHGITTIKSISIYRALKISGTSSWDMISYSFSDYAYCAVTVFKNASGYLEGALIDNSSYFPTINTVLDTIFVNVGAGGLGVQTRGDYFVELCGT